MNPLSPEAFFDLDEFAYRDLFDGCSYVWEALPRISGHLQRFLNPNVSGTGQFRRPLPETLVIWNDQVWHNGFELLGGDVTKGTFRVRIEGQETNSASVLYAGSILWDESIQLGPGVVIEPGALIKGPSIIGPQTEVRQGAYIRGKCIIGARCVVGHTTEMKGSVMLDGAKAGHFAYIGDSLLGRSSNLGAGTKLANLKIGEGMVYVHFDGQQLATGLKKFGAVLGDGVEIGCNAVTNPGTMLGRDCMVLPTISVRSGYHKPHSLVRTDGR